MAILCSTLASFSASELIWPDRSRNAQSRSSVFAAIEVAVQQVLPMALIVTFLLVPSTSTLIFKAFM
eukprot:4202672-Prymnesium_polylepis.1